MTKVYTLWQNENSCAGDSELSGAVTAVERRVGDTRERKWSEFRDGYHGTE